MNIDYYELGNGINLCKKAQSKRYAKHFHTAEFLQVKSFAFIVIVKNMLNIFNGIKTRF